MNAVHNPLHSLVFSVKVGVLKQVEIDFLAEKNNGRVYFQVALTLESEATIKHEFGNLLMIPFAYPKYVISLNN